MEGGIVGARKPQKAFITTKEQYFLENWPGGGLGIPRIFWKLSGGSRNIWGVGRPRPKLPVKNR